MVYVIIAIVGYLFNFGLLILRGLSIPAELDHFTFYDKAQLAIPFGPLIIAILTFIISPWRD